VPQVSTECVSMRNKNWSSLVCVLTSLASCSVSWGVPVARYGHARGYAGGYRGYSRTPRVYTGGYSRGYRGRFGYNKYNSERYGYHSRLHHTLHGATRTHTQPILKEVLPQKQVNSFIPQRELDRFIPAAVKQEVISEGGVSPGFSVEINFDEGDTRDIISEPFTNGVENTIVEKQSETDSDIDIVPVISTTQQRLIEQIKQQKKQQAELINNIVKTDKQQQRPSANNPAPVQPSAAPSPAFTFPPRLPTEQALNLPVQQPSNPVQQPALPVQQAVLPVQQAVPTAVQKPFPTVPSVQQPLPLPVQPPTVQSVQEPVQAQPIQPSVQAPRLPIPVLPEAVAAVPGRPVLADDAVLDDTVQSVSTVQNRFVPMPVPAVPSLA